MFQLVSHEKFPNDIYIKELAYISIDGKFRIAYARKEMKNGKKFWSPFSSAINQADGNKRYYKAVEFDSSFLEKDILNYLDALDTKQTIPHAHSPKSPPTQQYVQSSFEECPF